jgi:hypothetical protein
MGPGPGRLHLTSPPPQQFLYPAEASSRTDSSLHHLPQFTRVGKSSLCSGTMGNERLEGAGRAECTGEERAEPQHPEATTPLWGVEELSCSQPLTEFAGHLRDTSVSGPRGWEEGMIVTGGSGSPTLASRLPASVGARVAPGQSEALLLTRGLCHSGSWKRPLLASCLLLLSVSLPLPVSLLMLP